MKKSVKRFYATASLLTLFSIFERGLGFLYRIALSRHLGEEGLGVYQASMSAFGVFLTIGVGGLPITISRFIAKSRAENSTPSKAQTLSAGFFLSTLLSLIPALLFLLLSPWLAPAILPDERCLPVLKILLVGSLFASAFASLRGFFWGNKQFLIPTLFEVLEESVQVVSGIIFLSLNGKMPLIERVAWANTLSYVLSFSAAISYFFLKQGKLASPLPLAKPLFKSSLPITATRLSSALLTSAVAVVFPLALINAGLTKTEALKIYGVITGMALPVLMLPATVIGCISVVISPTLSENYYREEKQKLKRAMENGLTVALLLACGIIPILFTLGEEIGELIFSSRLAGEMIKTGCPMLLPMSLSMLSSSMLNSLGFSKQSFWFFLVGSTFLILSILLLTPTAGGYAYLVGMGGSFALSAGLNLVFLQKQLPLSGKFYKNLLLVAGLLLPISLFGTMLKNLIARFFGAVFACVSIGVGVIGFTVLLYFCHFSKKKKKIQDFFYKMR